MQSDEAKRFGSSQPNIAKSAGTGEDTAPKQRNPVTADINRARKAHDAEDTGPPSGRVADAGDAGGQNLPYGTEPQVDVGDDAGRKDSR